MNKKEKGHIFHVNFNFNINKMKVLHKISCITKNDFNFYALTDNLVLYIWEMKNLNKTVSLENCYKEYRFNYWLKEPFLIHNSNTNEILIKFNGIEYFYVLF